MGETGFPCILIPASLAFVLRERLCQYFIDVNGIVTGIVDWMDWALALGQLGLLIWLICCMHCMPCMPSAMRLASSRQAMGRDPVGAWQRRRQRWVVQEVAASLQYVL